MAEQETWDGAPAPTPAQRAAARVVGAILLVAMATSMFAELYLVRGLSPSGDAAGFASAVLANEGRYRLGALIHILTFASDAAIAAALFVVLAPLGRGLALLGALWRTADAALLAAAATVPFWILRLLESPAAAAAFEPPQLQALARWLYGVQASLMQAGWVFLGLGSAAFALLWFRSGYVPRLLAGWGVFASLLLAAGPAANLIVPGAVPMPAYMGPMFFYEVPLGLWLLVRGLRPAAGRRAAEPRP